MASDCSIAWSGRNWRMSLLAARVVSNEIELNTRFENGGRRVLFLLNKFIFFVGIPVEKVHHYQTFI